MTISETLSALQLWTTAPIVHVVLFLFVIDLYFKTSPRRHDDPVEKLDTPFADRVVIFIVNDLSSEKLFSSDSKHFTPYLEGLRRNHKASWGSATVTEPDDAGAGLAAILGGLHEKPKVRLMDWLVQKRIYDTIINRSTQSWIAGVPDGRHMDDKDAFHELLSTLKSRDSACSKNYIKLKWRQFVLELTRLEIERRRVYCEKYAADNMVETCLAELNSDDAYVLVESMKTECAVRRHLFKCHNEKIWCTSLCSSGNLFVVFLSENLSWPYKLNILDASVKMSVLAMNQFFEDSNTAYMVVSTKGKDGSVPYMLWGKGVNPEVHLETISQTDFAPLIATLLGIEIPVNSEGILPYQLLNGSDEQVLNASITNTNQLLKQFHYVHKAIFRSSSLKCHTYNSFVYVMQNITDNLNTSESNAKLNFMSVQIASMVSFLQHYHYYLKLFIIEFGCLFWLVYLGFAICYPLQEEKHVVVSPFSRRIAAAVINVVMVCLAGYMFYLKFSLMAYVYLVFIFGMTIQVLESDAAAVFMTIATRPSCEKNFFHIIKYFIMIELLVLGICQEVCLGISLLIVAAWSLTLEKVSLLMKFGFCSMIVIMLTLKLLPPTSVLCQFGCYFGMAAWVVYQLSIFTVTFKKLNQKYYIGLYAVAIVPFLLFLLGATYIFLEGTGQATSMFGLKFPAVMLSLLSVTFIYVCPTNIPVRIQHVSACLAVPMLMTSMHTDMLHYTALAGALLFWVQIEGQVSGVDAFSKDFCGKVPVEQQEVKEHDFRRVFFYLCFTICSFISICHMSNMDKLQLLWSENYPWNSESTVVLMVGAIKSCLPVFLTSYALYATNVFSGTKAFTTLTINLLYFEVMIMTSIFLFGKTNLTKSLNRFVLLNLLATLIIIINVMVKYTTSTGMAVASHISELKKRIGVKKEKLQEVIATETQMI